MLITWRGFSVKINKDNYMLQFNKKSKEPTKQEPTKQEPTKQEPTNYDTTTVRVNESEPTKTGTAIIKDILESRKEEGATTQPRTPDRITYDLLTHPDYLLASPEGKITLILEELFKVYVLQHSKK